MSRPLPLLLITLLAWLLTICLAVAGYNISLVSLWPGAAALLAAVAAAYTGWTVLRMHPHAPRAVLVTGYLFPVYMWLMLIRAMSSGAPIGAAVAFIVPTLFCIAVAHLVAGFVRKRIPITSGGSRRPLQIAIAATVIVVAIAAVRNTTANAAEKLVDNEAPLRQENLIPAEMITYDLVSINGSSLPFHEIYGRETVETTLESLHFDSRKPSGELLKTKGWRFLGKGKQRGPSNKVTMHGWTFVWEGDSLQISEDKFGCSYVDVFDVSADRSALTTRSYREVGNECGERSAGEVESRRTISSRHLEYRLRSP